MQDIEKVTGVFLLMAFALVAGSVICLASGQPSAMADCGDQMGGTLMCPFMSVSIPAATAASFGKEIAVLLVLALTFLAVVGTAETDRREAKILSRYWRSPERLPRSFLNPTLRLISEGVLHSRVFGF